MTETTGVATAAEVAPGTRRRSVSTNLRFRRDLQGVRAVAVLGVVIYHLNNSWLPGGFVGVDIFFVLSGFLITDLLLREVERHGRIDLVAFWGRRARRLLPAAAFVMIGTVLASLLFVEPIDAHRFARDGFFAAIFAVNWHQAVLGTQYLADPHPSPLMHYWSLGVEEQFYLLWPVILFIVAVLVIRRRPQWLRPCIGVIAVLATVASFLIAWQQTAGHQPFAYFATYSRAWQLGLGALIAAFAAQLGRLALPVRTLTRAVGFAAVIGFFVLTPLDVIYPGWVAAIPTVGSALVIVAGLPRRNEGGAAYRWDPLFYGSECRPAQLLGQYSYSWYLWHWPPLVIIPLITHHPMSTTHLIECGLISLVCAALTYHLLEDPLRSSKLLASRHGRPSLVLGAVVILAGVGASHFVAVTADHQAHHAHIATERGHSVVPEPGVAAAEENQAAADGCELPETKPGNAPECRYVADTGNGDIVAIGDSHAAQWLPALKRISKSNHWGMRLWTRANCPFADVIKMSEGAPNTACTDWRDNIMKRLLKAPPSLVVVAGYPPPGGPAIYDPNSDETVDGAEATDLYTAALVRQLRALHRAGIPALLILDEPRFQVAAPTCVLNNADDLTKCSRPESDARHDGPQRAAAKQVPSVHTFDLTAKLCHAGRCPQVVSNIIAYRDNNHLTHEMIARLEPSLARTVITIMT